MNRLSHLKKTYIQNIKDNLDYPNVEFILLNYNSSDNMDFWAQKYLSSFIEKGIVKYYSTSDPLYFKHSHSRNITFRMASGEILCNLDADNWTGKGFAFYINKKFVEKKNIIITTTRNRHKIKDTFGRICFLKKDFSKTGGFDETFTNYGWEDIDFINRVKLLGRDEVSIENIEYLQVISHDDFARISNEKSFSALESIYINYASSEFTSVLQKLKNNSFILSSFYKKEREIKKFENNRKGKWLSDGDFILLNYDNKYLNAKLTKTGLILNGDLFIKIKSEQDKLKIVRIINELNNKHLYLMNQSKGIIRTNVNGHEKCKLLLNFKNHVLFS